MKKRNSISNEKELELGRYLEADMIEITKDEVAGGGTPATFSIWLLSFISTGTCPSTACTKSC